MIEHIEKETYYTALFEYNLNPVYQFDLDGKLVHINKSGLQSLGIDHNEINQHTFLDFIHVESRELAWEGFRKVTIGEMVTEVVTFIRKEDQHTELLLIMIPIHHHTLHQVISVFVIAQDITNKRFEQTLYENEEQYRLIVEESPIAIAVQQDGQITYVNEFCCKMMGASNVSDLIGRNFLDFTHENDKEMILSSLNNSKTEEFTYHRIKRLDGSYIITHIVSTTTNFQGKLAKQLVILDMTQSSEAQIALKNIESKFRLITENMSDLISILDRNATILYTSPSYDRFLGINQKHLGQSSYDHFHPDDVSKVRKAHEHILHTKQPLTLEFRYRNSTGEYITYESTRIPIVDEDGLIKLFVVCSRDMTERKKTEATIEHIAFHDALTALPNRAHFIKDLHVILSENEEAKNNVAIMFLDLDGFKKVNDSLGHSSGDQFLQSVAIRLQDVMKDHGIVYRIGGDEFTIILPSFESEEALKTIADKLLYAFVDPWITDGMTFHVTPTFGIAMSPLHGNDVDSLMRKADMAMYYAKYQGKNTYEFFDQKLHDKLLKRISTEEALRNAIQNEEFVLYYQPQIDLKTREVIGSEALIRWFRPNVGMIPPIEFIPIAEENGLIVPIGNWAIRESCKQIIRWQEEGIQPIRIWVNLSVRQFQEPMFLFHVKNILEETQVPPSLIGLEITESLIMLDVEYAIETLQTLREIGFTISIDDFGTGYSSLSYLKRLPADKLKIDQSFVRDMAHDSNASAIVKTIVNLAQNLGLSVLAEGVETEEQAQALLEKECLEVQGYLFSKPIPADEFTKKMFQKGSTKVQFHSQS